MNEADDPFAPVIEVAGLFADYPKPWFIAGGWALDLFLGRVTRDHGDVDVGIFRQDQRDLRAYLGEWEFEKVDGGRRVPWPLQEWLKLPVHEIHAHRSEGSPREIELLLNETADDEWIYRRDARVTRALTKARLVTRSGIPYFAPTVVLLYKAKDPTEKNQADFDAVRPHLGFVRRLWLRHALEIAHPGNPWLARL